METKLKDRMNDLKPHLLQMMKTVPKDRMDMVVYELHTQADEASGRPRAEIIRYDLAGHKDFLDQICREFSEDKLEIRQTPDGGRGVFAKKAFKKGNKIAVERKPIVCNSILVDAQEYCDGCLAPLLQSSSKTSTTTTTKWNTSRTKEIGIKSYRDNVVNCPSCPHAKYCSPQCRESAWYKWHKVLCGRSMNEIHKLSSVRNESAGGNSSAAKHALLLVKIVAMKLASKEREAAGEAGNVPDDVKRDIRLFDLLCSLNDDDNRPKVQYIASVPVNDREIVCEELDLLNSVEFDFEWFLDMKSRIQANAFQAAELLVEKEKEKLQVSNGLSVYGMR
jgi:hypothetical protein